MNARVCQVQRGSRVKVYSPGELIEYGFKDGRVYCSKEVEINGNSKHVFLERISGDALNVYYYREEGFRTFFIESEEGIMEQLPRKDGAGRMGYREAISKLTADCPDLEEAIRLAGYQKESLSELFRRYQGCESKPFPFLKAGISAGYSMVQLRANSKAVLDYYNFLDFRPAGSLSYGVFIDNPIDYGNYSLHAGLYFSRHQFAASGQHDGDYFDFSADLSSIEVPVLIKYAFPRTRHRPYLKAGGIWVNNFRRDDRLNVTSFENSQINLDFTDNIYRNMMGVSLGFGIDIKLSTRNYLFVEINYNRRGGVFESASTSLNSSELRFTSGLNF